MSVTRVISLLKPTYAKWSEHQAPRLGASVAFYSVLSFAPILVLITAVIALIFGRASAQGTLVNEARQLIGNHGAETVQSLLQSSQKPASGVFAGILAFLTLLFGASGVFNELQEALNVIWEAPAQTSPGMLGMIKERLFSFGMVLSVGFLLLVSLVLSTGLAYLGRGFGQLLPMPAPLLQAINSLASLVVVGVLFALMFRYVPRVEVPWRDAIMGAFGTAVLFSIGKLALGIYLGKASVGSTYGAAGSLVAVIVWIYYSAQIFFFGAEYTHIYSQSRTGQLATAPAIETAGAPEPASAPALKPAAAGAPLSMAAAAGSSGASTSSRSPGFKYPEATVAPAAPMEVAPARVLAAPDPPHRATTTTLSFPKTQPAQRSRDASFSSALGASRPVPAPEKQPAQRSSDASFSSALGASRPVPASHVTKPRLAVAMSLGFALGAVFATRRKKVI